jgi:phage shock protein A
MSLKLFDRITTLVKADAHGVVESLEDRSLLLKQCVREAEIDLNRKRAELEALHDEEKRLRETQARREDEARALDEDVELALAGGKDDLARFAIRRLLPRRREAKAAEARLAELAVRSRALAERLAG